MEMIIHNDGVINVYMVAQENRRNNNYCQWGEKKRIILKIKFLILLIQRIKAECIFMGEGCELEERESK